MPFSALALTRPGAELFVPDGAPPADALSRTTHLGIGAHPDDLEIMAIHGILACVGRADRWFMGVVATDGAGSHAPPGQATSSPAELRGRRRAEQKRAAVLGEYGAVLLLDHPSAAAKDPGSEVLAGELAAVLRVTRPEVVYTHNLADAHDTHVAVALRTLAACRALAPVERPRRVLGCEVWRDLDWLPEGERIPLPMHGNEELQAALIGAFQSQLEGGKRYDLAALGRRRANATFHEIRSADRHPGVVWGMDLTAAAHGEVEPAELVRAAIARFGLDVEERLGRL